jgi:rubrerythrin
MSNRRTGFRYCHIGTYYRNFCRGILYGENTVVFQKHKTFACEPAVKLDMLFAGDNTFGHTLFFVKKTKRGFQVFDLNNEVELLMREIGRMVYLTHTGAETDEAALEEKLAQIDEKYAQLAALKEEQEAAKTTVICPVCGKSCDKNDLYCRICGEKLQ